MFAYIPFNTLETLKKWKILIPENCEISKLRDYSWRTVLTVVIFLYLWCEVIAGLWYIVLTGSGHCRWSLGWEVLGTFSLIPTPTKIPMAIFCQETTKKFGVIGQIFAYQKIAICNWRKKISSRFWKSSEFNFEGLYHV